MTSMKALCLHSHCDYYNHHSTSYFPNYSCETGLLRYERLNVISRGSYGVVYKARDKKTGEIVAMKHELQGMSQSTIREIKILMSLPSHPSVVGFRKVIHEDDDDRVFIVMEHLKTDLSQFMIQKRRHLTLAEVKLITRRILEGVNHLHENNVMHRDIKPANILMNSILDLKICDFGLSRNLGSESGVYTPGVVTLWYRAPEILLGEQRYTKAIDMWSVGCIMAELVLNEVVFPGKSEIMQLRLIHDQIVWRGGNVLRHRLAAAAMYSQAPSLTPDGLDLLLGLLAFDPGERISAKDALSHSWFN